MKYTVTNIDYDTDGEKIDLPTEIEIDVPDGKCSDNYELNEYLSDEITNKTGFCHKGFAVTPEIEY